MADNYNMYKICTRCEGTGLAPAPDPEDGGSAQVTCHDCDGTGKILIGWINEEEDEEE